MRLHGNLVEVMETKKYTVNLTKASLALLEPWLSKQDSYMGREPSIADAVRQMLDDHLLNIEYNGGKPERKPINTPRGGGLWLQHFLRLPIKTVDTIKSTYPGESLGAIVSSMVEYFINIPNGLYKPTIIDREKFYANRGSGKTKGKKYPGIYTDRKPRATPAKTRRTYAEDYLIRRKGYDIPIQTLYGWMVACPDLKPKDLVGYADVQVDRQKNQLTNLTGGFIAWARSKNLDISQYGVSEVIADYTIGNPNPDHDLKSVSAKQAQHYEPTVIASEKIIYQEERWYREHFTDAEDGFDRFMFSFDDGIYFEEAYCDWVFDNRGFVDDEALSPDSDMREAWFISLDIDPNLADEYSEYLIDNAGQHHSFKRDISAHTPGLYEDFLARRSENF